MEGFFSDNVFLNNEMSKKLYNSVSDLPIIDYHCHIPAKDIYEDKPFNNIGELWLSGDHYKWRLMRAYGIGEEYITGNKPWKEKFIKYAEVIATAAGNPLYHWSHLELKKYFKIGMPLNKKTALEIWEHANAVITESRLSPRKLIKASRVEYICTTDDVTDPLTYHKMLRDENEFKTTVVPTFRTDNLLMIKKEGYAEYIKNLAQISGINISDFGGFIKAIENRLDYFCEAGCRFSDEGIPYFPSRVGTRENASRAFSKAISGQEITDEELDSFLGYMFCFLAGEYKKRNIIMQLHIAVKRNVNTLMYNELGADCGGDCTGDAIPVESIINILDTVNNKTGLPKSIIYTLNPTMYNSLSTVAGSFKNVTLGAAWWFCDHRRGIEEQLSIFAETGHLGSHLGMLTDSRSFLSYARHDYFRRILCNYIGGLIENGEFSESEYADKLVESICFTNIKKVLGNTEVGI